MDLHIDVENFSGSDAVTLLTAIAGMIPRLQFPSHPRSHSTEAGAAAYTANGSNLRPVGATESYTAAKFAADGSAVGLDATDWVAARDPVTGLIWMRQDVPGGRMDWEKAKAAAAAVTLCGWKWRAPSPEQLLSLVDYNEHEPAVRKQIQGLLTIQSEGYWTSQETPWSPGCARYVFFGDGDSSWAGRNDGGLFVRAVCVGQ
jgi:hypothetical protein